MPYVINKACTKCGACLFECPSEAISEGKTRYYIDTDLCSDHTACVNVCPVSAISLLPAIPLVQQTLAEERAELEPGSSAQKKKEGK